MILKFQYENKIIDFELILSKRKTMSIEISAEGEVKVRAPMGISEEVIISQVMEKGKWILEKREEAYKRNSKKLKKTIKMEIYLCI